VLMGDGELQEGQVWEAAMYAAHYGMDNVIATVDYNGQQIDGPTVKIMDLKNLKAKWEAFGWEVDPAKCDHLLGLLQDKGWLIRHGETWKTRLS